MARTKGPGRPPYASLREATKVTERIYRDGGGRLPKEVLASVLGHTTSSSSFVRKISALQQFGVIETHGDIVSLTPLGYGIAAPKSQDERSNSLLNAFLNVNIFRLLHERYRGKLLPDIKSLENILVREFGVDQKHAADWAKGFFDALETVGLVDRRGSTQMVLSKPQQVTGFRTTTPTERHPLPDERVTEVKEEPERQEEAMIEGTNEIRLKFDGGTAVIRIPASATDREIEKLRSLLELMKKGTQTTSSEEGQG